MARILLAVLFRFYRALFASPLYLLTLLLCYIRYCGLGPEKAFARTFRAACSGLIAGFFASGLVLLLGIHILQPELMLGLLPLSLLLSRLRRRFVCYAYASAVLFAVMFYTGGMRAETASGLLSMIGILHAAEALLVLGEGGKERIWPVPFGILLPASGGSGMTMPSWWPLSGGESASLGELPLTALTAYESRLGRRTTAALLFLYGTVTTLLGLLTRWMPLGLGPAYVLQVVLHEAILFAEKDIFREKG